ncbi:MAG: class I SAM-dependent methyltransferase [Planctomycetota bacterium]
MERGAYDEMRALEDHHWWFRGKRRMLKPLISAAVERGDVTLLDVGCGTGANLNHVESTFPAVSTLGLDFDDGALHYCRGRRIGAGLLRGDGTRLPVRDGSLDCITALDIIEHFDDDEALIAELHRALRPGGELVASVPAYPWLWSPHDDFLHHKRRYRTGELQRKLAAAGFEIVGSHGFNFLLLPPIALVRFLKGRKAKSSGAEADGTDFFELPRPLNALMAGLFWIEDAITRVVPVPFGVSLLVRAKKR